MTRPNHALKVVLCSSLLAVAACGGDDASSSGQRSAFNGDYAGFLAVAPDNELVPGDVVAEANDWGGFYFTLASNVTSVRISITGAAGSAVTENPANGGTGGTGVFDMAPSYLASNGAGGFWVVLGEAGRPSAGETGPISDFEAFNGGGAGTDWHARQGTFELAAGGGGGSDVRLAYAGFARNPHAVVEACGDPSSRFAVVGGGGGATGNTDAWGGFGGGFNHAGGNGGYDPFGSGATTTDGGALGGALCSGGNGLQDGSEGWAGGGGGGYYGGGAPTAHGGGGGGSGFLLSDPDLTQVSTSDGTQGGNATATRHGAFTIEVD